MTVAYTNGKSAVRLAQGVVPSGPHRFTSVPPARRLQSIVVSDRVTTAAAARGCTQPDGSGSPAAGEAEGQPFCYPVLLHFVNCGFEEWRRKYKSLGTFNDSFCGKTGIPFKFHLSSRDLLDSGDSSATWAPPPPKCGSPSPRVSRDDDQTAADVAGGSADAAAEAAMRRRREGGKERRVVAAREMYAQTMVHDCQSEACQAKLLSGEFVRTTAVSSIVASLSR